MAMSIETKTMKEEIFLSGALNAWKSNIERADKLFSGMAPEQLEREIAPGKNRLIYLWGHLTAVHDAMLPLLGIGPRLHSDYDETFISKADKSTPNIPSANEVKKSWNEVNEKLREAFGKFSAAEWLQKHAAVSDEDFAKEPLRNRFAILLSRTNHLSYHVGQAILAAKS
jgi:DinB superfamily